MQPTNRQKQKKYRRWPFFLLGLSAAFLTIWNYQHEPAGRQRPSSPQEPVEPPAQVIHFPAKDYPTNAFPSPAAEIPPDFESGYQPPDLRWTEAYMGSYTIEELMERDGVGSLNLRSEWLIRDPNLPRAGITLREDTEGGPYKVSGGELFFPNAGIGVSYEKDDETGENKAQLHLEKEF